MTETDDSQTSNVPTWNRMSATGDAARVGLQTDRPHSARMYDYYLGGKDNFAADREAAEQALAEFPHGRTTAQQNRAFMHRAIRYLAGEVGIRQFLDIGTGIPTSPNLHEVAQQVATDARIVYADNDPLVLVHARALLTGTPAGRIAYLDADLRDVEAILASAELRETIDLTRPVAVSLVAILHFLPDADDPYGVVHRLLAVLPSGSHMVISHVTGDYAPETWTRLIETYRGRGIPAQARSHDEFARFFEGLDLVEPGIQVAHRWRPNQSVPVSLTDAEVGVYVGVGRKK